MEDQQHKIYTAGYTGVKREHLGAACAKLNAALVDIRLQARSRAPMWNKTALGVYITSWGVPYFHFQSLGNLNYRNGNAILISDPDKGLAQVQEMLKLHSVVLLCVCADLATCHRKLVADMLVARDLPVTHLSAADLRELAGFSPPPAQMPLLLDI